MDARTLRASVAGNAPPAGLSGPLQAVWQAAKGNWDKAHAIVQRDDSRQAAWVHAYLHRVEGDEANAGYWYGRAGRAHATTLQAEEWTAIVDGLLGTR